MANRRLSIIELETLARPLLQRIRKRLVVLSSGDADLMWALRRKVYKELIYDERGKPVHRRALKKAKREEQGGLCAHCKASLPARGTVLDRLQAMQGYTFQNTRVLCPTCDEQIQSERGFA